MPQVVACQKCAKKFKAPTNSPARSFFARCVRHHLNLPPRGLPSFDPGGPIYRRGLRANCCRFRRTQRGATIIQCPHCRSDSKARTNCRVERYAAPPAETSSRFAFPLPVLPNPWHRRRCRRSPSQPSLKRPPPLAPSNRSRAPALRPLTKPTSSTTSSRPAALPGRRPRLMYAVFALAFVPLVFQTFGGE